MATQRLLDKIFYLAFTFSLNIFAQEWYKEKQRARDNRNLPLTHYRILAKKASISSAKKPPFSSTSSVTSSSFFS